MDMSKVLADSDTMNLLMYVVIVIIGIISFFADLSAKKKNKSTASNDGYASNDGNYDNDNALDDDYASNDGYANNDGNDDDNSDDVYDYDDYDSNDSNDDDNALDLVDDVFTDIVLPQPQTSTPRQYSGDDAYIDMRQQPTIAAHVSPYSQVQAAPANSVNTKGIIKNANTFDIIAAQRSGDTLVSLARNGIVWSEILQPPVGMRE